MIDREKVLQGLKCCRDLNPPDDWECPEECPYSIESNPCRCCKFTPLLDDAIALLDTMHRAWETVKFSVLDTAQNNAGENEDVYKILMYVARLMDNQEKRWNDV